MARPYPHPSNSELESYLLARLAPEQVELIEKHYLTCEVCVGRLSETAVVIEVLQALSRPLPRHLKAERQSIVAPKGPQAAFRNQWASVAAATLIVSATVQIYQATQRTVTLPPAPAPIARRLALAPIIQAPLEPVTATSAPVLPKPRLHRGRSRDMAHLRQARPEAFFAPGKAFLPPPKRSPSRAQVQVAALELPGLEIAPNPRATGLELPPPPVPEFREKRNRLSRMFTSIAKHLKSRPPSDGVSGASFAESQ